MKTACIYHSIDLDGWMSAAIVKHWFYNNPDGSTPSINDTLDFIGYNYGQPIPDLSRYNKVIMCDISFPKKEMIKLHFSLQTDFIWIDHHISAIKDNNQTLTGDDFTGLRNTLFSACELTWKYFFPNELIPEIIRLLGRYDCFGHKGTDEEQRVLEFQYGARQIISNSSEAYDYLIESLEPTSGIIEDIQYNGSSIYKYLYIDAKLTLKNSFTILLDEPINDIIDYNNHNSYNKRKFLCVNKERFNPINFGIDYHKQGYDGFACFHFDGTQWCFSLYNDNKLIDCSKIAKTFKGGGHKGAAGFKLAIGDHIHSFINARRI